MPFILRKTVSETYLERVRTTPDAKAFQYKPVDPGDGSPDTWKHLTFREFDIECRRVSYGLMNLGISPGDRVAILSRPRYEWTLWNFAAMCAHAITVPVHASSTEEDCAYILGHSGAKIVICDDARQLEKLLPLKNRLPALERIVVLDPYALTVAAGRPDVLTLRAVKEIGKREEGRDPKRFDRNIAEAAPEDLIAIRYTSAPSGLPKGVMLSHANMMSVLEDCVKTLSPWARPEREVLLSFLPASHVMGKVERIATFTFGWSVCFAESADRVESHLTEIRPTILFGVPSFFEKARASAFHEADRKGPSVRRFFDKSLEIGARCLEAQAVGKKAGLVDLARFKLAQATLFTTTREALGGRLRLALCGGAPLPLAVGEFFRIIGLPVLEGYGLTETCGPVSVNTPDHHRPGSVGRPFPEVAVKISPDGEVLIQSRKVFKGYYNAPRETSDAVRDGWLYTGDIGSLDSHGYLWIRDRKKDLIATQEGFKVAPRKIEDLIRAQSIFAEAAVIGAGRPYLSALLTLNREQVIAYAQGQDILFSDFESLSQHPKILGLAQRAIDEVNRTLAPQEAIRRFLLLPGEFSVASGELTVSRKLRRGFLNQKYRAEIDSLYPT